MPEQNSSISSFKKFLFRILLPLIIIVSGAGLVFNYLFEQNVILKNQGCGAAKVNRLLHQTNADEIPILGSSRAEGGVLPDSLGPNYFNYGLSGTGYDVTLFFAEQECKKKKNTPWILLELDLEGLLHGLGDVGNYIPCSNNASVKALMGSEYKPYFAIPFLRYYGRFESYLRSYMNQRLALTKISNKGALIEKNAMTPAAFAELVYLRENLNTVFTCDTTIRSRLLGIINNNPDRKFVFFVAPYHKSFFKNYLNAADAGRFLDTLAGYKNVRVLNFGKMELADSQFLNTSHVNFKGAVAFNRALKDSLIAIGVR